MAMVFNATFNSILLLYIVLNMYVCCATYRSYFVHNIEVKWNTKTITLSEQF